jgi:hypothetical protein
MNHWTCTVPGCHACGAGYPSERAAIHAKQRHDAVCRAYHLHLTACAAAQRNSGAR